MATGELIKKYRKQVGLTQKQLAEKANLAVITIQGYEAGKFEPKANTLYKLVEILKIPTEQIYISKTLQDYTTDELLAEIKRRTETKG